MPQAFVLDPAPRVAFGAGRLAGLGEDVAALAGARARVLLVCDPGVAAAGLVAPAEVALSSAGLAMQRFTDLASDPLASHIDAAAEAARSFGAGAVVGFGGGSALDVAKLAAAIAPAAAPAEHYALAAQPLPETPLPTVCVPTTAGTGAEVTRTVVFTTAAGAKVWGWGEALRPDLALLDPELCVGLPAHLTAATGVDALVHAIEAATNRRAHPLTDGWALQAIALIRRHLPQAVRAPLDLEARGAVQIAACLAGLAIDGAGTAIAHALGHGLGALGRVHHGRAVGLALRAALAWNAEAAPARHAAVARAFGLAGADDAALATALAPAYDAFLREVGLPLGLADHGLSVADAKRLVAETLKRENRPMLEANCRPASEADLNRLARAILTAG